MAPRTVTRGLTVAELLIFFSLASLLVALGMYTLSRYLRHAKTAEAIGSVTTVAGLAASFFNGSDSSQPAGTDPSQARATRHFPPPAMETVPADLLDVRGKKYRSSQADWAGPPWHELRFSMPQVQYYAYGFQSEGAGSTARASATAVGDLDGDGHSSRFEAIAAPDDKLEAKVDPNVRRSNPEE